mgnify:CR=1 FL=1
MLFKFLGLPVSFTARSFSIIENQGISLTTLLTEVEKHLPLSCELIGEKLVFSNDSSTRNDGIKKNIELVVLGEVTLDKLQKLTITCGLSIIRLSVINVRNNVFSVRFDISTEDLPLSRKKLAEFTLTHGLEAALIVNAPSLAQPGLLVMDMDSTTIEIECIDEIAVLAGVGEQVAEVTELAMQGKLDFSQSLYQRVATLKDAPESILADVAKDIPLMPGLIDLVEELKKHHWKVAIASGGFTYFADHLKVLLKLDGAFANTLEIVDGKLTGKVIGNVVDANVKAQVLNKLQHELDIAPTQTVAMGDGANDLIMMDAAQLGVAYKAKSVVLEQADTSISHSGLDCMLHWLK